MSTGSCAWIEHLVERQFTYEAEGDERAEVEAFAGQIVDQVNRHQAVILEPFLDLDGRKAILAFAANLAYDKSPDVRKYVGLAEFAIIAVAAASARSGVVLDPEDIDKGVAWFANGIEDALRRELGDVFESGGERPKKNFLERIGSAIDPHIKGRQLLADLDDAGLFECHGPRINASFRAWMIKHKSWDWADRFSTFRKWKDEIETVYLVVAPCGDHTLLLGIERFRNERALKLVAWRSITQLQWDALEPKLAEKLRNP